MGKPETLEELCDYITEFANDIYIREKIDGKWGNYSLAELPNHLALYHSMRFIKEGTIPVRILRDIKEGK